MTTEATGAGQPPEITLLGADPLQHTAGCPFVGAGATATDTEDGDLTDSIIITGTENLDSPGLQTLTYSVTDSSGRKDEETRQVAVSVAVGTAGCLVGKPEGKAPNLIVYVHGCCTNAADVNTLRAQFSAAYKGKGFLLKNGGWEIVVWDWSDDTPPLGITHPSAVGDAYRNAEHQGTDLYLAISPHSYKYVHLIGHSAAARLIDKAAKDLVDLYNNVHSIKDKPFIHLTFLDAYQPNNDDS